jgi:hypothetical protein
LRGKLATSATELETVAAKQPKRGGTRRRARLALSEGCLPQGFICDASASTTAHSLPFFSDDIDNEIEIDSDTDIDSDGDIGIDIDIDGIGIDIDNYDDDKTTAAATTAANVQGAVQGRHKHRYL